MKLISFCVFGEKELYTEGVIANATLVPTIYPGWKTRVYAGDDVCKTIIARLKELPDTEVVIYPRSKWTGRSAQILRFLPAGEPGIDAILVRDADSRVNTRESMAVAEWMSTTGTKYHLMHEAMHDDRYGPIMGGMWGARRVGKDMINCADVEDAPCPGLIEAMKDFVRQGHGDAYGDDMAFLKIFLAPQITEENCVHHVDGDTSRSIGALRTRRYPFPRALYKGFVGQPITCNCAASAFVAEGCPHVSVALPGGALSRISNDSMIVGAIGSFLN